MLLTDVKYRNVMWLPKKEQEDVASEEGERKRETISS